MVLVGLKILSVDVALNHGPAVMIGVRVLCGGVGVVVIVIFVGVIVLLVGVVVPVEADVEVERSASGDTALKEAAQAARSIP